MIDITIDNDETSLRIQIKSKGVVCVDAIELTHRLQEIAQEMPESERVQQAMSTKTLADLMRLEGGPAWVENGTKMEQFTDHELAAAATRAYQKVADLGKEPSGSPTSLPPPAS